MKTHRYFVPFYIIVAQCALSSQSKTSSDDGFCAADGDCDGLGAKEKHVEKEWAAIRDNIEESIRLYQPCENTTTSCACYEPIVDQDLSRFENITAASLSSLRNKVPRAVTYQIVGGRVYRSPEPCLFPLRCKGAEHFLLEVAPKVPDVELVVNFHDWPHISMRFEKEALPLFSFSKTDEYADIFYPAWTFWAGGPATKLYPKGLGRWDLFQMSLHKASQRIPWADKEDRGFFRGSRTSAERDPLILLSRRRPELVDAQYTKNQAWKSPKDTLGADPASEVALEDHCKYKFLFNYRGVAASFRFKHLFMCGSLVFHVGDEWREFFYPLLKPWVHYVPVSSSATEGEIELLLEFFMKSADVGRGIATRGQKLVQKKLRMEDVSCYWTMLLQKYASLLDFKPKRNNNYVEIQRGNQ